jgi:hypothetical protein
LNRRWTRWWWWWQNTSSCDRRTIRFVVYAFPSLACNQKIIGNWTLVERSVICVFNEIKVVCDILGGRIRLMNRRLGRQETCWSRGSPVPVNSAVCQPFEGKLSQIVCLQENTETRCNLMKERQSSTSYWIILSCLWCPFSSRYSLIGTRPTVDHWSEWSVHESFHITTFFMQKLGY